jgi:hypothetical protein
VLVLDHMNGRLILGIGRGLGRIELERVGVTQEDSRAIVVDAAQNDPRRAGGRRFVEYDGRS